MITFAQSADMPPLQPPSAPISKAKKVNPFTSGAWVYDEVSVLNKTQADPFYILIAYLTHSATEPRVWERVHIGTVNNQNALLDDYTGLTNYLKEQEKEENVYGTKIYCGQFDPLNPDAGVKHIKGCCRTNFPVKNKVYINGPKKNPDFLTKKGKFYPK